MKFKVWLDSGANIHSRYEQEVDTSKFGLTDEEFEAMSEDKQEEFFRDIAFERSDWGWKKL